MKICKDYLRRKENIGKWFGPARFGLFYHWGLFTAGGSTSVHEDHYFPMHLKSVEEFEAATPAPEVVAKNMLDAACQVGARYITFTMVHTCDAMLWLYPSKAPGYLRKTKQDYLGAVLDECARRDVKCIVYFPNSAGEHWNSGGTEWIDERYSTQENFAELMRFVFRELFERYGDKIAGFWMDGCNIPHASSLAEYARSLKEDIIFNINNETDFDVAGMDMCTTEFLAKESFPSYNRPDGLSVPNHKPATPLPPKDFNEDIPTCNGWWNHEYEERYNPGAWQEYLKDRKPYVEDKTYFVKEMLASLGQRGQWNYTLGIGPKLDGTMPEEFRPMFENMHRFMGWAGEAIYNTTGGEGSLIRPGWWNWWHNGKGKTFGSVTRSLCDEALYYLHVTTAPEDVTLQLQTNGAVPSSITDLRTGKRVSFGIKGRLIIHNDDWNDVGDYGAKIFQVKF